MMIAFKLQKNQFSSVPPEHILLKLSRIGLEIHFEIFFVSRFAAIGLQL